MTQTQVGWVVGVAAGGMMLGLMGQEVAGLMTWAEALTPAFVGEMFLHASVVVGAFVGGKLIPTPPTAPSQKESV